MIHRVRTVDMVVAWEMDVHVCFPYTKNGERVPPHRKQLEVFAEERTEY